MRDVMSSKVAFACRRDCLVRLVPHVLEIYFGISIHGSGQ